MTARDDDLVRWLRENGQARLTGSLPGRDLVAAADLIDRLRAEVDAHELDRDLIRRQTRRGPNR